jgi:hypothetical protein
MTDVNIQQYLNTALPAILRNNAEAAKKLNTVFQLNITGPAGGAWILDTTDKGPTITPGTGEAHDCLVVMADTDFQKCLAAPIMQVPGLFFHGKIKVAGNKLLVLRLAALLQLK